MKTIKDLQTEKQLIKKNIKDIENEIISFTKSLQDRLNLEKNKLKEINCSIETLNKEKVKDKTVHVIERYTLWLEEENEWCKRYIVEPWAFRNKFSDIWEDKYKEYSIIEQVSEWIYDDF